jgi:predicted metal-dependent HD superfamily phosphohydrolase
MREIHDPYLVNRALEKYSESHRFYHNVPHPIEMFETAREMGQALTPAQKLAVLFHDWDYTPGAPQGDNERASAQTLLRLTQEDPRLRAYAPHAEEAAQIILDTINHKKASLPSSALVLDLDLSRLAAAWPTYQQHTESLRQEMRTVNVADAAFNAGVSGFYRGMLERDLIFHTPEGQARFEAAARQNMTRSLAALEADPLPGLLRRPAPVVDLRARPALSPG